MEQNLVALAVALWCTTFAGLTGQTTPGPAEEAKRVARGKVVYTEQKCSACHRVDGAGNKRSVLDGVGSRLTPADVRQWIVAPRKMKAVVRKPDYSKVNAADVDALVAYVMSLKKQ